MWHLVPTVNGWKSLLLSGFPPVQNGQNSPSLRRLFRMDNPIPKILVARQPLERLFGHQMTIWQDKGSTRLEVRRLHRANFPPITGSVDVGRSEFRQLSGSD